MRQKGNVSARLALCVVAACASGAWGSDMQQGVSPTALYLRAGTVDTARATGDFGALVASRPAGTRFVVQLDGPITPERRARMVNAGMRVGDYLPSCAYIVHFDQPRAGALGGLEFVRWVGEYQNSWKLDPELLNRPYVTPERRALLAQGRYSVVVSLFAGVDPGAAEKAIWALEGAVIRGSEQVMDHLELMVELPQARVGALAGIAQVQYVEPAPEVTARNSTTRWIIQSNQANVTPVYAAGIHGEGQVVGVLDNGFDINHCSFRDATNNTPGPNHRKVVYRTDGVGSHGTHCSGTAVGDNGDNGDTRGMAYAAKMAYSNWPSFTETGMINALTPHYNAGARVHTNSWGDDGTTAYNSLCRGIDSFQYMNEESQIMFAVTNLSALKNPENAKNLVAVGNSNDTPTQGGFCTGGAGPTSDGRRKPEIWAPGCNTNSAASGTSCGITQMTGTSMASPAVTGAAALVRQYYTDGYYGGGLPNPSAGFIPSAALIKATMLNSGENMDAAGYPGVREGWGRLLLDRSLYFGGEARKQLVSDTRNAQGLSTGGITEIPFTVVGGGEQLRVTVVWTEPPAAAGAAQAAVNDLDLEVVAPNAAVYKGNVFDASGNSTTGGTRDDRNNVEQVHVTNPTAGQWILRVRGANVAVGTQGFASVVTGDIIPPSPAPLYINLVSTVPALLAPGTPLDVDVRITAGTENYQAGSGRLHYRMTGSGPFSELPLASIGGDVHRATVPGASCGDTPQFYATASGTNGANVSLPSNAPTSVLSTQIGTINTQTVMTQDFSAGLPAGWSATGLWHISTGCAPSGTCAGAGGNWMYYGRDNTCTFNTGVTNSGTLSTPSIALPSVPAGGTVDLRFCTAKVSENSASWDIADVLVNGVVVGTIADSSEWQSQTISLTQYAGQNVTIGFRFDTVDGTLNDFRGWHIDGLSITATTAGCSNPTCYANCDGSTVSPVLNVADFTCFLQRFAAGESYANCDGSTVSPVLNVADFTCFLQQFATGCP